jgi:hypothetical protein
MGCAFVTATRKCVGVLTFALSAVLAQFVTYPLLGHFSSPYHENNLMAKADYRGVGGPSTSV